MAKIDLDKYYTPDDIVDLCLKAVKEVMLKDGVVPSRVIEPSAGNGAFSKKIKNCIAYDIEPEDDSIIQEDFLSLSLKYEPNTLIVGNPPFGRCLSLAQKFYKKSIELADYIGFILPISQLNNNRTFYEFDLIKSIDLGKRKYSDRELHCCFNIYKKPKKLNSAPISKLECVKIIRQDSKNYENEWFDIRMCYWGNGSAGKILNDANERYSGEYKIQIKEDFKERVIGILCSVDWKKELNCIAMRRIKQYDIIDLLKREIPEIY